MNVISLNELLDPQSFYSQKQIESNSKNNTASSNFNSQQPLFFSQNQSQTSQRTSSQQPWIEQNPSQAFSSNSVLQTRNSSISQTSSNQKLQTSGRTHVLFPNQVVKSGGQKHRNLFANEADSEISTLANSMRELEKQLHNLESKIDSYFEGQKKMIILQSNLLEKRLQEQASEKSKELEELWNKKQQETVALVSEILKKEIKSQIESGLKKPIDVLDRNVVRVCTTIQSLQDQKKKTETTQNHKCQILERALSENDNDPSTNENRNEKISTVSNSEDFDKWWERDIVTPSTVPMRNPSNNLKKRKLI